MNLTRQCLDNYSVIQSGRPIQCGHVFREFSANKSVKEVVKWAALKNGQNDYPSLLPLTVKKLYNWYKSRYLGHFQIFENKCKEVAHAVYPLKYFPIKFPITSTNIPGASSTDIPGASTDISGASTDIPGASSTDIPGAFTDTQNTSPIAFEHGCQEKKLNL